MKNPLRAILSLAAIFAIVFSVLLVFASHAHAQDASAPVAVATASPDASADLTSLVTGLLAQFPWASSVLAAIGVAGTLYNVLITWAHQRAAATASDTDDKWLASLESKWWFRLLDRVFYFGGYLGARLGGKKL